MIRKSTGLSFGSRNTAAETCATSQTDTSAFFRRGPFETAARTSRRMRSSPASDAWKISTAPGIRLNRLHPWRSSWRCSDALPHTAISASAMPTYPNPMVTTPAKTAIAKPKRRCRCRLNSRRRNSSKPTFRRPAINLRQASFHPSLPARASAAMGSVARFARLPSGPKSKRSDGAKHSTGLLSWPSGALGSPSTMRGKICSPRPSALKVRISSSTHREAAALGEQMTISERDDCRAARIS